MYEVPPYKCINQYAVVLFAAGMSIFHDLVILVMPIPTLWKLNMQWQKKANLVVMFSGGSFVIVCSLRRLPSLLQLKDSSDPSCKNFTLEKLEENKTDYYKDNQAPIVVWTHLELAVGIICACLPASRSLLGYIFPSLKMSIGPNSAKTPQYSGPSASSANYSRRRGDTSTQSLIELDDRVGNRKEDSINRRTRGSMISLSGSEAPIHERFVPYGKEQEYSHEFRISVV
jgi:hypothetical protein